MSNRSIRFRLKHRMGRIKYQITQTPTFEVGSEELIDCGETPGMPTVQIDCYGRSFYRRIEVVESNTRWVFRYKRPRRLGVQFRAGVFFDRAAVPGPHLKRVPRERRFAVLVETPNEAFFDHFPSLATEFHRVMTHRSDFIDLGNPFTRLSYGTNWVPAGDPAQIAAGSNKTNSVSFLGSIQHDPVHGYVFRKQVATKLLELGVDCFGRGLVALNSKTEGLAPYRFSIAMENTRSPGYFTEKLIDCFHSGTVPVYWGDPTITSIFDSRGLVEFGDLDELESILPTLTEARYSQMLPHLVENLKRCIDLDLADTAGMYRRIARKISSTVPEGGSSLHGQIGRLFRQVCRTQ